jgi:hypothetical protein
LRFPVYYNNGIGYSGVSSPPCMPNYHLGAMNPICWATDVDQTKQQAKFAVYPNPATTTLQFEYNKGGNVVLSDITGRKIRTVELPGYTDRKWIDIIDLTAGIYIYEYIVNGMVEAYGKLVVR